MQQSDSHTHTHTHSLPSCIAEHEIQRTQANTNTPPTPFTFSSGPLTILGTSHASINNRKETNLQKNLNYRWALQQRKASNVTYCTHWCISEFSLCHREFKLQLFKVKLRCDLSVLVWLSSAARFGSFYWFNKKHQRLPNKKRKISKVGKILSPQIQICFTCFANKKLSFLKRRKSVFVFPHYFACLVFALKLHLLKDTTGHAGNLLL